MERRFLMLIVIITLSNSIYQPSWYATLECVVAILTFIGLGFIPEKAKISDKDFEQMKSMVEGLGNQLKVTANKVSFIQMRTGLKEPK